MEVGDISGAGDDTASETEKRALVGESRLDVGVLVGLQAMISSHMKKIVLNAQKTPTAQNQHTYVQGGRK